MTFMTPHHNRAILSPSRARPPPQLEKRDMEQYRGCEALVNLSCVEHALSSRLYNKIVPLTGLKTIRAMYLVDKLIHIRACKRAHPATKSTAYVARQRSSRTRDQWDHAAALTFVRCRSTTRSHQAPGILCRFPAAIACGYRQSTSSPWWLAHCSDDGNGVGVWARSIRMQGCGHIYM